MWSANFRKICLANLLTFISLFMLLTVLSEEMFTRFSADGLSLTAAYSSHIILALSALIPGAFCAYLSDEFKRKTICATGIVAMMLSTFAYTQINTQFLFFCLCVFQGVSFGLTLSMLITLSIDVNLSEHRTKGNFIFALFTCAGVLTGVLLGKAFAPDFQTLVYYSLAAGFMALVCLLLMKIPFRAPIGLPICSLDRFLLPRSLPLVANVLVVSVLLGVLFHYPFYAQEYLILPIIGCLIICYFMTKRVGLIGRSLLGFFLIILGTACLYLDYSFIMNAVSGVLLGMGMIIVFIAFLSMFIGLTAHCQRATANTTYLFTWFLGLNIGQFLQHLMKADSHSNHTQVQVFMGLAVVGALLFFAVSLPYYKKMKLR